MSSTQPGIVTNPLLGDRYEVLSSLGSGAAANVFRIRDLRGGAVRAAKVLKTENAANAEILARFEDEFRILRTLHHPHLPDVFNYGWTGEGGRFLVMELVDGEPLDRYFRAHPEDIWVILYQLCEVLVFVHARNLLHQDIKPSNILVSRAASVDGGRPIIKLIDFGLTHRRGTGAAVRLVGTAEYIAPEVVRGERALTRAVDYYSLGATLFELLCGAPPFVGSESAVLRAHLERTPVIENEELEWAELYPHVRALLSKDSQQRLAAFEEFRRMVVGRLTGGIDELDRSYALARIDSLGMIGKKDAWHELLSWLDASVGDASSANAHTVSISGGEGVGKRFLTGALRAEASMRGIRTMSPAEVGLSQRDVTATRQPALMWARLLEACEKEPVVLVVERPLLLPDEERSFVRLAGTQWELFRSRGRVLPLFFLVAVDSTTDDSDTLDYLPADGARKLKLPALGKDECAQVVDQFRGSMFDPRDARSLTTYLDRFDDAGSAIQGLQRAVLRGGLTFLGQRWKVQPGLLTEVVRTEQSNAFSHDLVESLSPLERSVAAVVSAHPDPVPLSWIGEFVGADASSVPSLVAGTLRRLVSVSGEAVSPASAMIRGALRAGCDPDEMRRAHEFLSGRVAELERTVSSDRALAYHYEQLGRVRDAARVHLRLLRSYWSVRPRERPYELIEGVCRSGLELLEAHGTTVAASTRRHLFCFYIKEWIKAFWARNLFTHAKPVIDEWTKRLNETMPASVAPRYVRSVLELEGPKAALEWSARLSTARQAIGQQLLLRLELERTLALHAQGDYQGALKVLSKFAGEHVLSRADQYRIIIYRAMNFDEVHGMGASVKMLSEASVNSAHKEGCVDEALLMLSIRARGSASQGEMSDAIRDIARGLGIARRAGLNLRANFFYRLGATAYSDTNNVRRAQACLQRSVQLAGSIGLRYMAGTGWARLAEKECASGRFGNGLRCSERALEMMGAGAPARDINQARTTHYSVSVLLRRAPNIDNVDKLLMSPSGANERGYYHLWRGRDLVLDGQLRRGLDSFEEARGSFVDAGFPFNITWAMLQEARVHLLLLDRDRFDELMSRIRISIERGAPASSQVDLRTVELAGRYLFRHNAKATLRLAEDAESLASTEADTSLRIELLQVIFRVYARNGRLTDGRRVFELYRGLLAEVLANVDPHDARAVADMFSVTGMVEEYEAMVNSCEKEGDPLGSPL